MLLSHTALLPLSCNTVLCFTDSMDSMCCMSNKALNVGSRGTIEHSASPRAVWAS